MQPEKSTIQVRRTGRNVELWQHGKGPDLVFLHGAGGLQMWGEDLARLARSFRVTAPVHPGFGASEGIEEIGGVLDSVLHTFDVLDELGIRRPYLVGHSMGGMLAAEMAAICPHEVERLALVCPVGLWDDAHPVVDFFTLTPPEIVPYVFYNKKHPLAKAMEYTPESEEELTELFVEYVKGLSAAGRLLWPIPDRGLKTRLNRITAPTLILWGEADKLVSPFYAGQFKNAIKDSRVRLIKKASHMVLLEQTAEAVGAIARFFKSGRKSEGARPKPPQAQPPGKKTVKKKAAKKKKLKKKATKKKAAKKTAPKRKASKKKAGKKKAAKKKAAKKNAGKKKSRVRKVAPKRKAGRGRRR